MSTDLSELFRYSAKLLFQFRVDIPGAQPKMRMCEERIVVIESQSADSAYEKAMSYGNSEEFDFVNSDENSVYFEFVGLTDLLELGPEVDEITVWYGISTKLEPKERAESLIPDKMELPAIKQSG